MNSIYDNIDTARELVIETIRSGLGTATDDRVRAQDIIGNTPQGELIELANSEHSRQFYNLLFQVWNWEDAVRFFNNHTNPVVVSKMEYTTMLEESRAALNSAKADCFELRQKARTAELEVERMKQEVLTLKAKLYDMMSKGD